MPCFSTLTPTRPAGRDSSKLLLGNRKPWLFLCIAKINNKDKQKVSKPGLPSTTFMDAVTITDGGLFDELLQLRSAVFAGWFVACSRAAAFNQ